MSLKELIERESKTFELSCEGVSFSVTDPGVNGFILIQTTADNSKPEEFMKVAVDLLAEINTEGVSADEIGRLRLEVIQELITQTIEKSCGGSKK